MEGTVTVGCGEFTAVEVLAEFCRQYREKYPLVQIAIHTATADITYEMMNKGLVDVGLFMEPVNTEGLEYIRITDSDHWVVGLRPDDPLVKKEFIEKEDLIDKPLILPERTGARSLLATGSERISTGFMWHTPVIWEPMRRSWHPRVPVIRFPWKGQDGTGGRIFLSRKDCIRRSLPIRW